MKYLTVGEFAERAGMHAQTVRTQIAEGTIHARQRVPHSPYKIPESEIEKIGAWRHELYT